MPDLPEEKPKKGPMGLKEVAYMSTQIGFSVAITTVLFVGGGRYLDIYLNTSPLFTLLGIVLGLAGALWLVWQIVKPLQAKYKTNWKSVKENENTKK